MLIDTGLEYRPGDAARVRVVGREHRISVTDDGAAIAKLRTDLRMATELRETCPTNTSESAVGGGVIAG